MSDATTPLPNQTPHPPEKGKGDGDDRTPDGQGLPVADPGPVPHHSPIPTGTGEEPTISLGPPHELEQGLARPRREDSKSQLTTVTWLLLLAEYRRANLQAHPEAAEAAGFPRLFGRFMLHEVLGQGGYGIVFRATDPRLGRDVAIKVPRLDCLSTAQVRERFLFEGRAAAVLDHPNIVAVYEAGEIDRVCFLTTAYSPGETLANWLRTRETPVSIEQAVRLVTALAEGVGHAHSRGVLHRDLKPANVLLSPGPDSPRVTDFGLARMTAVGSGETYTGQVMGTPGYMAPEQAAGDNPSVGTHSDVYSLGVILYEMLTGNRPFAEVDQVETLRLVITEEVPVPRRDGKRLPRDLESVCLKCLEKAPADRYPSGRELAEDLRRFLAHEPVLARPLSVGVWVAKWCRRRRAAAGFIAASLAAVLVLAAAAVWHTYEVGRTNDALRDALEDADRQRQLAEMRAGEYRLANYAAQVRVAAQLMGSGQGLLMRDVLDPLAPRAADPDSREFTWRLLWRQARNDTILQGHRKPVHAVAYAPDGKALFTVADDATIRVWDPVTGRLRKEIRDIGPGTPRRLAVSADGTRIAVGFTLPKDTGCVRVWDSTTGARLAELRYTTGRRPDVEFVGNQLVVNRRPDPNSPAGALLLWNWQTDERQYLLRGGDECHAMAVAPDGKHLAAACPTGTRDESSIRLLSLPDGREVDPFPAVSARIDALTFSPDGRTLAGGGDGKVSLLTWDVTTRTVLARSEYRHENTQSLAFDQTGRGVVSLASHTGSATTARLRLRDAKTGADLLPVDEFPSHADVLAAAPREGHIALADGATVRLRRLHPLPPFVRLPGHGEETWGVAFTPDGRSLLTSSDDWTVAVWDLDTHARRNTFTEHGTLPMCVAIAPNGEWAVSSDYDGEVMTWDVRTGCHLRTLKGHTNPVGCVAVSPDGLRIASVGRDLTTRLWDARTGEELARWEDHGSNPNGVAFTPNGGRLVSVGSDHTVVVRELATNTVTRLEGDCRLMAVAITPDGKSVVAGGENGVPLIWDLATGRRRTCSGGHAAEIKGLAVSPDGRTLATTGLDKTVRLWHLPTGVELCKLGPLSERAYGVAFSPDGTQLAAGLFDGSVLLWSTIDKPDGR